MSPFSNYSWLCLAVVFLSQTLGYALVVVNDPEGRLQSWNPAERLSRLRYLLTAAASASEEQAGQEDRLNQDSYRSRTPDLLDPEDGRELQGMLGRSTWMRGKKLNMFKRGQERLPYSDRSPLNKVDDVMSS